MKLIGLLFCLGLAVTNGYILNDERVVGGSETTTAEYPFVVSLKYNNQHFCGGVIYSQQYVLTAASCLFNTNPTDITVVAGDNSLSSTDPGEQRIQVAESVSNENFDIFTSNQDIAFLKLSRSFTFNNNVNFAALASETPAAGSSATLIGWGSTQQGGQISNVLRKNSNIVVRDDVECTTNANFNPDYMFCAGGAGNDACSGDAGSPLVTSNKELFGLVSYSRACANQNYPTIYTKVLQFTNWIGTNGGTQPTTPTTPTTTASTTTTTPTTTDSTTSTTPTTIESSTATSTTTDSATSATSSTMNSTSITTSVPTESTTESVTATTTTASESTTGPDTTVDYTTTDPPVTTDPTSDQSTTTTDSNTTAPIP